MHLNGKQKAQRKSQESTYKRLLAVVNLKFPLKQTSLHGKCETREAAKDSECKRERT